MVVPVSTAGLEVTLETPIVLERGLSFMLRECGCTIGSGVMSNTID